MRSYFNWADHGTAPWCGFIRLRQSRGFFCWIGKLEFYFEF
jgi:hypothetical protein